MACGLRAPQRRPERELTRPVLPEAPRWSALDRDARFAAEFFAAPVVEVARGLLGACLVSTIGGELSAGVIVETEAYGGAEDAASHAATVSGVTDRNRAMFGPGGRVYVYRSYGMHWCMNVVTGTEGEGQAVLLRGLSPIAGTDVMLHRRGRRPLAAGPGRLAQALGITDRQYAHDLSEEPLFLIPGWAVPDARVASSPRVGINAAADWQHRFYVRGAAGVSGASR